MLCQNCSKAEATTHIKRIINGEATETHLCSDCARSLGYDDIFDSFHLSIPGLLAGFFSDAAFAPRISRGAKCEGCGASFEDIISTGMVGCAKCYETFFDRLMPSLKRIHGKVEHVGKVPLHFERPKELAPSKSTNELIEEKSLLLQEALKTENYEQAAVLRDEIRALKEES